MSRVATACLTLLALASASARADRGDLPTQTDGWYLGGGLGYSQVEVDSNAIDFSDSAWSYRVTAGYRARIRFLPWNLQLGLEGGWLDLNEHRDTLFGEEFRLRTKGLTAAGIAFLPLGDRWELFGKAGAYLWDGRFVTDDLIVDDDRGTDALVGVGAALNTGTPWSARLEFDAIDQYDGMLVGTLSVVYQFK